ncbi:hypothetical protein GJAV_G00060740 [Gymnothorax javanicus]|nr:hypothetical protein GJAV_G00060740 [Gymnothorax javanicus]
MTVNEQYHDLSGNRRKPRSKASPDTATFARDASQSLSSFVPSLVIRTCAAVWKGGCSCDIWVIHFLRERTLGNCPSRMVIQLRENHSKEWLQRILGHVQTLWPD